MGRFRQRGQILNEDEEEDENVLRQRGEDRGGANQESARATRRGQRASERRAASARPAASATSAPRTSAPPPPRHGLDGYVGRTWASCNGRLQFTPRFLEGKISSFICLLFPRVRFLAVGLSSDRKSTQTKIKGCVSRRDNVSSFVFDHEE